MLTQYLQYQMITKEEERVEARERERREKVEREERERKEKEEREEKEEKRRVEREERERREKEKEETRERKEKEKEEKRSKEVHLHHNEVVAQQRMLQNILMIHLLGGKKGVEVGGIKDDGDVCCGACIKSRSGCF